ncbi:heme exporter protein CcmB [Gracilimonas mengyeensis]|uniref:Heme exporter protein B n=1 Tax=Gracilimonas mengyeensis TaxID=1302730 RepID=A0A521C506_9BACT|nr:heme exporter protein CcmB [Gracilimonas mengyeensis]SMO54536.1 heme exporter protein B [Gracilimonas mengyeensis]
MQWIRSTLTILKKDLQIELRTRFAFNMVLAFVAAAMLLVLFTLRADQLEPGPKSGLVWIIILFAALSALSRSFIAETDKRTFDLLRIYAEGTVVYTGKLLYNFLFTLLINVATFAGYIFMMGLSIQSWPAFLVMLIVGTAGLSGVATMTAAVVSQADRKGAIFSVLSIPLFMPLVLLLADISKTAFVSGGDGSWNNYTALIGFAGVTITAGVLLFDYIWEE